MNMKNAFRLGALFALVFFISNCGGPEEKKTRYFEKGKALYEQGDYVKARPELKNAIRIDPNFTQAHYLLGMVSLQSGNIREAYGSLSKAASLDPLLLDAQLQLGKLLLGAKRPEESLSKAEIILKEEPEHEEALFLKASVLLVQEKTGPAAALLEGLIDKISTRPGLYLLLASAYAREGRNPAAEETLLKEIALEPAAYAHREALAWLYWRAGEKGIDDFYALAVRPGEVSTVPVPTSVLLLGSALIGFLGLRRKPSK